MSVSPYFLPKLLLTFLSLLALYHCVDAPPTDGSVLERPRWMLWACAVLALIGTVAMWLAPCLPWLLFGLLWAVLALAHLRSRIEFNAEGFSLMGFFRPRWYSYGDVTSITSHEANGLYLSKRRYTLRVGWRVHHLAWSWDKRSQFLNLADMAYRRAHNGHPIPGKHEQPRRGRSSRMRDAFLVALMFFLMVGGLSVYAGYPVSEDALETFTADVRHVNDLGGSRLSLDFGMADVHSLYKTIDSIALLEGHYTQPFTAKTHGEHIVSLTDADGTVYMTLDAFNACRLGTMGEGLLMSLGFSVVLFVIVLFAHEKRR